MFSNLYVRGKVNEVTIQETRKCIIYLTLIDLRNDATREKYFYKHHSRWEHLYLFMIILLTISLRAAIACKILKNSIELIEKIR